MLGGFCRSNGPICRAKVPLLHRPPDLSNVTTCPVLLGSATGAVLEMTEHMAAVRSAAHAKRRIQQEASSCLRTEYARNQCNR